MTGAGIAPALKQGLISEQTLDASVSNVLRQKFAAGLFEGSWKVDAAAVKSKLDTYRPLALEAARQGITLLTNPNATLPISFGNKKILVVGSLADDASSHCGGYTNGGAKVITTWNAVQALCNTTVGCSATHIPGASPGSFSPAQIAATAAAAASADLGKCPAQPLPLLVIARSARSALTDCLWLQSSLWLVTTEGPRVRITMWMIWIFLGRNCPYCGRSRRPPRRQW